MLYQQCELQRGSYRKMAWIPKKFAVRKKVLKIKGEDGWVVQATHSVMEQTELLERSQDYKRTRKASDI